ncbi:hypothetical protein ABPG72_015407 [Tetrahymena utriculariae]
MQQIEMNSNSYSLKHIKLIELFLELHDQNLLQGEKFHQQNSQYSNISETTYQCDKNSQLAILHIPCQQNYFSQRQNQIKNLLNSFKNHIAETQDEFLMDNNKKNKRQKYEMEYEAQKPIEKYSLEANILLLSRKRIYEMTQQVQGLGQGADY